MLENTSVPWHRSKSRRFFTIRSRIFLRRSLCKTHTARIQKIELQKCLCSISKNNFARARPCYLREHRRVCLLSTGICSRMYRVVATYSQPIRVVILPLLRTRVWVCTGLHSNFVCTLFYFPFSFWYVALQKMYLTFTFNSKLCRFSRLIRKSLCSEKRTCMNTSTRACARIVFMLWKCVQSWRCVWSGASDCFQPLLW